MVELGAAAWQVGRRRPAKLDRLFRSDLDTLKVVESLKGRGVKLHLLDLGGDIAGNGISKLFLTIARHLQAERDRIRERISQVKADQKARGRYLGGALKVAAHPAANGMAPIAMGSTRERPSPSARRCEPSFAAFGRTRVER